MNETTITITLEEYRELVRKAERIATIERILANDKYICKDDILNVLAIQEPVSKEGK